MRRAAGRAGHAHRFLTFEMRGAFRKTRSVTAGSGHAVRLFLCEFPDLLHGPLAEAGIDADWEDSVERDILDWLLNAMRSSSEHVELS